MDYQFIENGRGDAVFSVLTIPSYIDLANPPDEILEQILVVAKETLQRMRIEENVKPVNNLPKWF